MTQATIADRRLHPATILLDGARHLPSMIFAVPAGFAFISGVGFVKAMAAAAALVAVTALINWLSWRSFRYGVGPSEIVIESGILSRNRRSIPFARIQDVDIERRLLARLMGLARVKIETGGSAKDEGVLDSVTVAEADRLRAAVRAGREGRIVGDASAIAAVLQAATEPSPTLFAMAMPRVLLSGLFNFSLVYLAGVFTLLQTFREWLPFDIYDPARWFGLVGSHLPSRYTAAAIFTLLLLAILLGVVAGIARMLARDHGFRLADEGRRFRRERGLFTRSEVVLAKRRLQLALISTGPIRRRLGWHELLFQSLGAGTAAGGHQSAAPLAKGSEIAAILDAAGSFRTPAEPQLSMVSRRHALRSLLPLLPALMAIVAAGMFRPPILLLLLLMPFLAGSSLLQRRFHRYGLEDGLLFVERGVWRQRRWIVPVANAQSITLSRSPLQRWLGLATVAMDTAGAPATASVRIVDLKADLARALAAELLARRRTSGAPSEAAPPLG